MRLPSGFAEVPCARCGRFVEGLAFGELCRDCKAARARRANRIARLISLPVTALAAAYVSFRLPPTPNARIWAAVAVVVIFLIVRRIVKKVAMDLLPD
jgi:lipopolysaccharide export LptBFGC system permease protein LptF